MSPQEPFTLLSFTSRQPESLFDVRRGFASPERRGIPGERAAFPERRTYSLSLKFGKRLLGANSLGPRPGTRSAQAQANNTVDLPQPLGPANTIRQDEIQRGDQILASITAVDLAQDVDRGVVGRGADGTGAEQYTQADPAHRHTAPE